jgi:hypothetical protein
VSSKDPHWKLVERVAALVEKSLDGSADVRVNQHLPSLKYPKEKPRQCDVTVRTGPPQRRTLTIVEVQKRKKAFDITLFDGLCAKMREVGAQHLVCVSAKPFPSSVVARAAEAGPTVRLATIRELEESKFRTTGMRSLVVVMRDIAQISEIELLTRNAQALGREGTIDFKEKVFSLPTGESVNLDHIAKHAVVVDGQRRGARKPGGHRFRVETDHVDYLPEPGVGPVRLRFMVTLKVKHVEPPLEYLEYTQEDEAGTLAWVMTAKASCLDPDRDYTIRMVFRPAPDGRLQPHLVEVDGLAEGSVFSAQLEEVLDDVTVAPNAVEQNQQAFLG